MFSESCAIYEIMWKKYGTARQVTNGTVIRRMRFEWWLPKATETEFCNTAFPRQQWLRERASMLRLYVVVVVGSVCTAAIRNIVHPVF
jgi:hypothetical protein